MPFEDWQIGKILTDLISDYLELASRALRLVTWLFATHLRANIGIYIADVRKKKETASLNYQLGQALAI